MAWPSPAKVNLFLHITGRRDDGYHDIQTAFQFLDYSDSLEFQVQQSCAIELLTPIKGVKNESNLIIRAAKCLQSHTDSKQGAKISIEKKAITNILNSDSFMSTVVVLNIDGKKQKVLPREVAYHVVSDEPIHIDFMRVLEGSKIIIRRN